MKHIKTPVHIGEHKMTFKFEDNEFEVLEIIDAKNVELATIADDQLDQPDAAAQELVCALNAHDALVEACETFERMLAVMPDSIYDYVGIVNIQQRVKEALALALG